MSLLESILTAKPRQNRKIVLYGPGGVGKTTWAAGAPSPIIIRLEDGCGDILPPPKMTPNLVTSTSELMEWLGMLATEKHDFKTVVIDSITKLEPMIHKDTCARFSVNTIEKVCGGFYRAGYREALVEWRKFIEPLDYLHDKKDMNIILIAHDTVAKTKNPDGEEYGHFDMRIDQWAADLIAEWSYETLFAKPQIFTNNVGDDKKKKIVGISDGVPVLFTKSRPSHRAKCRLLLPEILPMPFDPAKPGLGWQEYAKYLK